MTFNQVKNHQKYVYFLLSIVLCVAVIACATTGKKGTKSVFKNRFDVYSQVYDHEMHNEIFSDGEAFSCENCHKSDESYENYSLINPLGCHVCHNPPPGQSPDLEGPGECNLCHVGGWFPKPKSHKANWNNKHQVYAKQDPKSCVMCHSNNMFCLECHMERDTIKERMHRRNFKYYHSIEARANPRKCSVCHTVNYCQECHTGRGTSKR